MAWKGGEGVVEVIVLGLGVGSRIRFAAVGYGEVERTRVWSYGIILNGLAVNGANEISQRFSKSVISPMQSETCVSAAKYSTTEAALIYFMKAITASAYIHRDSIHNPPYDASRSFDSCRGLSSILGPV